MCIGDVGALVGRLAVPAARVGGECHSLASDGDLDGLDGDDLSALSSEQSLVEFLGDDWVSREGVLARLAARGGFSESGRGRHDAGEIKLLDNWIREQDMGRWPMETWWDE
jgi:hypothetical protein